MTTASGRVERVLVGVDGSSQSLAALDWAIAIARPLKAELVAVYALPPPSVLEYGNGLEVAIPTELDPRWQAEMKQIFESAWCSALNNSGLRFRRLVEQGRAATVIASAADSIDADLVVVGRRGRGDVAELLLGSVSHELSHHCRRPVVLISTPSPGSAEALPSSATAGAG